jgi:hypothetical protein
MTNVADGIREVLVGFRNTRPRSIFRYLAPILEDSEVVWQRSEVIEALTLADPNGLARRELSLALSGWDYAATGNLEWAADTGPLSEARRELVYSILGFEPAEYDALNSTFPIYGLISIGVYKSSWDPWYDQERRKAHNFYWNAYRGVLEGKNWEPEAIASVDEMTTRIVGRLADPTSETPYQAKGLVAGYVQSGKTANFTGLVAKSIDVGYRLVIVLTGTIELLRTQAQRRIDMELVGEENILGGVDRDDVDLTQGIDYIGSKSQVDQDWISGKFVKHGANINAIPGVPSIVRLTSFKSDFRRLKLGLAALDFRRTGELKDPHKPVYDPVNIYDVDARLAVIKKNTAALKALIQDLKSINAHAREIPVLIIDDEADQASINTKKPSAAEVRERTAINKLISELLTLLPRAQYLGYTATPYANVFASPGDSEDIFPKDFIISLEPPPSYMGARDFHDLVDLAEGVEHTAGNRNEIAFVRDLRGVTDDEVRNDLRSALDCFVLSGAIKLWRASKDSELRYPHHTMLVHSSVKQQDHKDMFDLIAHVWQTSQYSEPAGFARLRSLYDQDFAVTTAARDWGPTGLLPAEFAELKPFLGQALTKIKEHGTPAVIVNGSKESDYDAADFTRGDYWRILVGGAKLSRGFTVEGLTVSYFARRTQTQAALMQMGRWFGYRPGYRDLVRLFIAREVFDGRNVAYDLYDDFTSIVQDEEDFREQLRVYSELTDDGRPVMTPLSLPPLVYQRRPGLRPVARNQMYNAELVAAGIGGHLEFHSYALRHTGDAPAKHKRNFDAVAGWLGGELRQLPTDGTGTYSARVKIVPAEEVYAAVERLEMQQDLRPSLGFMRAAIDGGHLEDFAIIVPESASHVQVSGLTVPIATRQRRTPPRDDFAPPGLSQRSVVQDLLADVKSADSRPRLQHLGVTGGSDGESLWHPEGRRGVLLLTFIQELIGGMPKKIMGPEDVIVVFANGAPFEAAPRGRLVYRAVDESQPEKLVIDAFGA